MSRQLAIPGPAATRRAFTRAAGSYDAAAVLQQEVGRRLLERLDVIRVDPARVLDVGAGTGAATAALMARYPRAQVLALDPVPELLSRARQRGRFWRRPRCICGDARALPVATGSIDLLVSNLALPWIADLDRALEQFRRALVPEGLLLFSSFGPDTLKELRQAWGAIDDYVHVHDFVDMHDVGDAMMRAAFVNPVMEVEHITLTYQTVDDLMRDLRQTGGHNLAQGRRSTLTPRRDLDALRRNYERWRQPDGRLPATFEIVFGHAWAPRTAPQRRAGGEVHVPLTAIRRREKP